MRLTVKQIKGLLSFACRDELRPHINGLHFCSGGETVVATDGHTLTYATNRANACGISADVTLRERDLLTACKPAGAAGGVEITLGTESATIVPLTKAGAPAGPAVVAKYSDVNFPPWRQVVPASDAGVSHWHGVNPSLLARMADLQAGFFPGDGVKLVCASGELDPIRYDWQDRDQESDKGGWSGTVVIMPMRI